MVRVTSQGGILDGENPSLYDPKNPIVLFIIQAGIIIIFTRLLHFPLSRIRQPRVIAEVIGGILLGPSVLGRAPHFTSTIFPAASMPTLSTAANLGLILFLFLVGLEVDLRLLVSNWRIALSVGLAGMILPFGLGCAIAYGLFHAFREDKGLMPINFGTYMLFIGVATAITAFPVLCRILTELKLLQTQVGIVVLSAGVGNDVVGWILLALSVALVNAGSGITAFYVLLVCLGYILFLVYAIRPALLWLLRKTGSLQNGPSQSIVALLVLMVVASAFFTGVCGVHPIFGAFLIGLICPHDGGFAIKLTEKIEDLVTVFFLPLYFALSGLSTNIGLLNNGKTWGYVIGVIAVAFFGKFAGGTLAARANKLVWRESFTIGALMSCKGLVELIVLNIGLQAKILSQRTFTIFVVMALVTTFATTPLTSLLYPPWYQRKLAAWKRGEIDWDGKNLDRKHDGDGHALNAAEKPSAGVQKLLVCLRLDSLPSLFALVDILGGERACSKNTRFHPSLSGKAQTPMQDPSLQEKNSGPVPRPVEIHGLRLLELTDRLSSVMKDTEADEWSMRDPVVNAFHTFGQLNNVAVSGDVQFVPDGSHADVLTERAALRHSDLIVLPWSETGAITEVSSLAYEESIQHHSPFQNTTYNHFVARLLSTAPCSTGVFINNGFGATSRVEKQARNLRHKTTTMSMRSVAEQQATAPISDRSHHLFCPFFGGADDRAALQFVLRLSQSPEVTATIVYVGIQSSVPSTTLIETKGRSDIAPGEEIFQAQATETEYAASTEQDRNYFDSMRDGLPQSLATRVMFDIMDCDNDISSILQRAQAEVGLNARNAGDLVVIGRRHRSQTTPGSPTIETNEEDRSRNLLGPMAETLLQGKIKASVLVLQARK